ncbi:MAG: ABC transporter substrate-binding protein [Actinomycetota bacterium]
MRRSAVIIVLALAVAACGKSTPVTPAASATGTFPATITAGNGSVTIAAKPKRIVSLSPTSTEILFAIGAGAQVIAVDDQSNYPTNAPKTTLSGFEPNVEAIAGYTPDLVVFADDSKKLSDSFKALKIPAILHAPAKDLDDAYAQIKALGVATGRTGAANALVDRMRKDIRELASRAPKPATTFTYYHELDDHYFSVTSSTFIGKVYALLGLKNIADPADKSGGGYPQLSPEYIIQSNPSLIFLADTKCCSITAETVTKRPGWDKIAAVKDAHVVALDDDMASRWGPRIVDLLRTVSAALETLKQAA